MKQKGFSLIELLIVVAIILIIAAIAIPNLIKSKMAANEASAVGSIRTINTSQVAFASACPDLGFTNALADFATGAATCPGASGLLDSQLVTGTKSGYSFALTSRAGFWRTIDVYVPYRQENADALARAPGILFFGDHHNAAIRWRNQGSRFGGYSALRIAEKIEYEGSQKDPHARHNHPMKEKCRNTQGERGQPEVIALFNHVP